MKKCNNICSLITITLSLFIVFGFATELFLLYDDATNIHAEILQKNSKDYKFRDDMCGKRSEHDHINFECDRIARSLPKNAWNTAFSRALSTRGFCATQSCTDVFNENYKLLVNVTNMTMMLMFGIIVVLVWRILGTGNQQQFVPNQVTFNPMDYVALSLPHDRYGKYNNRIRTIEDSKNA